VWPQNEKVFVNQRMSKVLGIWFIFIKLSWKYPEEKRAKELADVKSCIPLRES
jgi:hypothetical protein